ncbi:MAG: hypothetical protein K0R94_1213, partial [Burkholderiales bacterium]|nr:hypothetical protein [Burkholderiales bacterium]
MNIKIKLLLPIMTIFSISSFADKMKCPEIFSKVKAEGWSIEEPTFDNVVINNKKIICTYKLNNNKLVLTLDNEDLKQKPANYTV